MTLHWEDCRPVSCCRPHKRRSLVGQGHALPTFISQPFRAIEEGPGVCLKPQNHSPKSEAGHGPAPPDLNSRFREIGIGMASCSGLLTRTCADCQSARRLTNCPTTVN